MKCSKLLSVAMVFYLLSTSIAWSATYTVDHLLDDGLAGSLRWAMLQAESDGTGTVDFDPSLTGTIVLTSQLPTITASYVVIDGLTSTNGITISGENLSDDTCFIAMDVGYVGYGRKFVGLEIMNFDCGVYTGYWTYQDTIDQCYIHDCGTGCIVQQDAVVCNNVISGNEIGLYLGSGNAVYGNYIGTTTDGMAAFPNTSVGIYVNGGPNYIGKCYEYMTGSGCDESWTPNVIAGSYSNIEIHTGEGATIYIGGNLIGTNADGTAALGGIQGIHCSAPTFLDIRWNTISGHTAESGRNQPGTGIYVCWPGTTRLSYNKIGTDVTGSFAVPNEGDGIFVLGTMYNMDVFENVISGNGGNGMVLGYQGTFNSSPTTFGNQIGVNVDGNPLGNGGSGIYIAAGGGGIGHYHWDPTPNNVIAYNGGGGITNVDVPSTGMSIGQYNQIYENGGLAFDLGDDGVTLNDGSGGDYVGPDGRLDYPEVWLREATPGQPTFTTIYGESCPGCEVLVFAVSNDSDPIVNEDPSGHGEAFQYLGSAVANEYGEFVVNGIPEDKCVTLNAGSSEFSPNLCYSVNVLRVTNTNPAGPGSLANQIEAALASLESDSIVFDVAGTISLTSELPALEYPSGAGSIVIDGCSAPGEVILDGGGTVPNGLTILTSGNAIKCLSIVDFTENGIEILAGSYNRLWDNSIGIADGVVVGNGGNGIYVHTHEGGSSPVGNHVGAESHGNVLAGNVQWGIKACSTTTTEIRGNEIDGNGGGVYVLVGTSLIARENIMTWNANYSLAIEANVGATITANRIGVDIDDNEAGNGDGLIVMSSRNVVIDSNCTAGNGGQGIFLAYDTSITLRRNLVGMNTIFADTFPNLLGGMIVLESDDIQIGTEEPTLGNIIYGNSHWAVYVSTSNNVDIGANDFGPCPWGIPGSPGAYGITFYNSTNCGTRTPGLRLSEYLCAVAIEESDGIYIQHARIENNDTAIFLHSGSQNCNIAYDTIVNNHVNVAVKHSDTKFNRIIDNVIYDCVEGPNIDLWPPGITHTYFDWPYNWNADSPQDMLDFPYIGFDEGPGCFTINAALGSIVILYKVTDGGLDGSWLDSTGSGYGGALVPHDSTMVPCDEFGNCPSICNTIGISDGDIITALAIDASNNTSEFGPNLLIESGWIVAMSPVHLEVTDPAGHIINKDSSQIPGAVYDTTSDFNGDSELDEVIYLSAKLIGEYTVSVSPDASAEPEDTYSLVTVNGEDTTQIVTDHSVPVPGETDEYVYMVEAHPSCCAIRADINHDGQLEPDIADLIYMVTYMFQDGPEPPCMEEADIDGNGSETPDIADLIHLVTYMFQEGPNVVSCP